MTETEDKKAIETALANMIYEEYENAKNNKSIEDSDYEAYLDLFDCVRAEKNYEWNSNIAIPEVTTHMLVQAGLFAGQYFKSRDFVEVYVNSSKDEDLAAAEANKELINRTLNQKHLYYYHKSMRAVNIKNLGGSVYLRCWWETKRKKVIVGRREVMDESGEVISVPVIEEKLIYDRFNFEPLDPRDVFTSNEYTYSLQQKKWVIIRYDSTLENLEANKELMGYINLDRLKYSKENNQTETKGSENSGYYTKDQKTEATSTPIKKWMILERYGKYWCKVLKRNEIGEAIEIEPAVGGLEPGEMAEIDSPLVANELLDVIIAYAVQGSRKHLIRFQLNPYKDAHGESYIPLIRGLCYIHPTTDVGFGDGKSVRELQIALDDTINISNDRVLLATIPTMKVRKLSIEDNPDIHIEPGHLIPLINPEDLEELRISDNVVGAMNQIQYLTGKMNEATGTFPTTMGSLPALSSTTATAVAGAESRGDMRNNYRSLNYENTLLTETYWMDTQMTYQFAAPETAEKLMGDKMYDFNPGLDYTYKPVSESIETEVSKRMKLQNWQTLLQTLVNIQHPDIVKKINYVFDKIAALMGDEYENFSNTLLNPEKPTGEPQGQELPGMGSGMPASNQAGMPQSEMEAQTRNLMGAGV